MAIPAAELQRFEEETAFERYVISSFAFVDPDSAAQSASADLRKKTGTIQVKVNVSDSLGSASVTGALAPFRALVFGAAYTITDLLVELAMRVRGGGASSGRLTFATKVHGASGLAAVAPMDTAPSLWAVLMALYAWWEDAQHSLVHRTATVDLSTWALTGYDRAGNTLPAISAAAQEAFARLADGAAVAVLAGSLAERELLYLGWYANKLAGHYGGSTVPAAHPEQLVPRVLIDLEPVGGTVWRLDRNAFVARAQEVFADRALFDAELFADTNRFACRLDEVPEAVVEIDSTAVPGWLRPLP
jgi:hypothetical protein